MALLMLKIKTLCLMDVFILCGFGCYRNPYVFIKEGCLFLIFKVEQHVLLHIHNMLNSSLTFSQISVRSTPSEISKPVPRAQQSITGLYSNKLSGFPNKMLSCNVAFCAHACCGIYAI